MPKGDAYPPPTRIFGDGWGPQVENLGEYLKYVIPLFMFYELSIAHSEINVSYLLEDSIPGICGWGRVRMYCGLKGSPFMEKHHALM